MGRLNFRHTVRNVLRFAPAIVVDRAVPDPSDEVPPMLWRVGHAGMPKDLLELGVLLRPNLRIAGRNPQLKQEIADVTMLPVGRRNWIGLFMRPAHKHDEDLRARVLRRSFQLGRIDAAQMAPARRAHVVQSNGVGASG